MGALQSDVDISGGIGLIKINGNMNIEWNK
jgi:hypothetical protein